MSFRLLGLMNSSADISFRFIYNPVRTVEIFGGLTPFNISHLHYVPVGVIDLYFTAWSYTILSSSQFVLPTECQPESGSNCSSFFLPGGVEIARLLQPNANLSLLTQAGLPDAEIIIINDAPGYQVDFFPLEPGFTFNATSECDLYGEVNGQGLYLCLGGTDVNNYTIFAGQ